MSEDWLGAQNEIAEGIASVGVPCAIQRTPETTGSRPNGPDVQPVLLEVTATQTQKRVRDDRGALIGRTMTVLLVAAGRAVPLKGDEIAFNLSASDVTSGTAFQRIADVSTQAPTGVPLYYEVTLED